MPDLILVHASRAYPGTSFPLDHYAVMHNGEPVGSIVRENMAGAAERWWWEIGARHAQRADPRNTKGPAASRDEALIKFRAAWDAIAVP